MKPACYNREPFTDRRAGWVLTGEVWWKDLGPAVVNRPIPKGAVTVVGRGGSRLIEQKAVCRYRWPWFTDRCEAWNPGPGHVRDTVPAREGWQCDGCKHLPAHARAWIRGEDGDE